MNLKAIKRMAGTWLLLLFPLTAVVAQGPGKVIQWSDHPEGSNNEKASPPLQLFRQLDTIEIEEVRVEGTPITMGTPFNASVDWLRNTTFRVKNLSNEP